MWKIFFITLFLTFNSFAQSNSGASSQDEQFNKQLEEIMNARAEMLKALMDDSSSSGLEKRMEEMMRRFSNQGDFGFGQMEGAVVGEYDWTETDTSKILKIKVKQIKDKPLDIKIENNEIKIKGEVESTEMRGRQKIARKVQFERTFEMPDGIDKTNPEFENGKDGFMQIKFKKLTAKKLPPKNTDRIPVTPDSKDLSI